MKKHRSIYTGRLEPYTTRGISRVPCSRCGRKSHTTWQACANGHRHVGLCKECDILLNEMGLEFMRIKNRAELMALYRKSMEEL
ncbi:hypothetical protein LCGC14_2011880 [marine sediment metagenome]|uniref:Uncharacterized protein n=1 Tax=marine sediment metagenome TaxID=412755 RepID=A0A0F9F008_9ZZZZ